MPPRPTGQRIGWLRSNPWWARWHGTTRAGSPSSSAPSMAATASLCWPTDASCASKSRDALRAALDRADDSSVNHVARASRAHVVSSVMVIFACCKVEVNFTCSARNLSSQESSEQGLWEIQLLPMTGRNKKLTCGTTVPTC